MKRGQPHRASGTNMNKKDEKSILDEHLKSLSPDDRMHMDSATIHVSRDTFIREIPMKHRAYLEITGIGSEVRIVELRREETVIGRTSECDIPLPSNNVSRKHACVGFRNEEYHIKDLNSTNGVYVNGVRIEKCVLRNLDQIEIGGIKLMFNEEQTLEQT
jgi:pSer/pThr/pTyr-binding forkhead associated (FHA) protein